MNRHRLASFLVAALLVGGCGIPRSGALGPAPTAASSGAGSPSAVPPDTAPSPTAGPARPAHPPRSPQPGSATPTATGAARTRDTVTIELWLVRAGRLVPTRRTRPATVTTSRLALAELAAGPTRAEAAAGLTTVVAAGVEVTRIAGGVATLRVPAVADPARRRLRDAQLVWTLTQFPTVRQVRIGDAAAVGRADVPDLLPPIVVSDPLYGERVTTPLVVTGTADVFEATVSVRVLDAAGREVATAFGTAGCGSGCRGGYRVVVGWHTTREQRGTVEVYEVSAQDGSRIHTMAVPVLLAPGG
ncbi:Gmad2 immunoglobulin-like domain-containing protein [Micromonospora sp. WMMD1120]|uniref:Gmad2 immunoglobulin-like domain-containing protein n=1 Tax=Micromonospora sp. WMMD1120 TaxID=3016106 RepID=UPI002417C97F|nr:Gmad2 immunoglobulin-like domain-containing protein [Micromonospora sp. WMMD1120]MDG4809730.1 Gmad2 immunoglobulin-like domain-containing protein [Micromonospora sp. WMMD1120]